jgi:hypothetical protein
MKGSELEAAVPRCYRIDDMPAELLVGEPLEFTVALLHPAKSAKDLKQDWVGIYPTSVPTLPGLSHYRWKYLSAAQFVVSEDQASLKVRMTELAWVWAWAWACGEAS